MTDLHPTKESGSDFACKHGYPAGEYCPACGELPSQAELNRSFGYDEDDDFTVLGYCIHGVDLDRDFCSEGCRV